ncbi:MULTISPECIES: cytochrome b/b6 domain-containing protein [Shewanella]|jgi:formate dehydrogenase subunit gamma|uniref:Cytochrome b/b6 domain-containing protein n=1 Tax=Shewanella xiamenensis TaxID=332186 RepID=A0ABT6UH70_9GAMM|nr:MULTISPECIES: cytochrome b/b6 domain-containing protein [Shewanella]PZP37104.1 MAG: formate dehydrogenase [Shewanella oneidensis]MBW0280155.1 formate dehydrogenase [Shewanella xiamenensis]MCT8859456.1 cytochrome b/b6 domain-containing protein [Shewanella xiamenensis]MCT8863777.1 cytochrome b/b6 domain-containing protein [Shewanella xiamenensis]MCT8866255.1 cytochrome b/b6 domain-containing protein [Shewanella xiamenensis]
MHQEHDMRPILKHPLNVRIFHYILLLSFLPLAATGLLLFFKPLSQEGMQLTYDVHIIAGIVMALDAVAFTIMAFDRVVLFIARVFSFSGRDVKWFMVLGGYPQKFLLGKKVPIPPMNKYNSGQKLFGACVLIGGTLLILSGLVLWLIPHAAPRDIVWFLGQAHLVSGLVLTAFLPVHLFLAVYRFDDFKAMMIHGNVPYHDAAEYTPLWVKNEIAPVATNGEQLTSK